MSNLETSFVKEDFLSLCEPMLAVANECIDFQVFFNNFQNIFFHNFARNQSESDRPVIIWVLKTGIAFASFPLTEISPDSQDY